jgi:hypothetical protein
MHPMTHALPLRLAALALLLAIARPEGARGQIDVSCAVPCPEFLQWEPIPVEVTLRNNTGSELRLSEGDAPARLELDVQDRNGLSLAKEEPAGGEPMYVVPPMGRLTVTNQLFRHCVIRKQGAYTLRARVAWRDKVYVSEPAYVDVIPGRLVDEVRAQESGGPAARTYQLRTLHRGGHQRLFLRIEDEDAGICYGVFDLGQAVFVQKPEFMTDAAGDAHVLFQSAPGQFVHVAYDPQGVRKERRPYITHFGRVKMETEAGGTIKVTAPPPESEEPPLLPAIGSPGSVSKSRREKEPRSP